MNLFSLKGETRHDVNEKIFFIEKLFELLFIEIIVLFNMIKFLLKNIKSKSFMNIA